MVSKTQTEEYLRKTQLPVATKSYAVISHGEIIDAVRDMLAKYGFIITSELYKAECNGDIALGFMQIETQDDPDMAMTFNWTNSYNKMVRFSCSIGGFIYDNQVPFVSTNSQASWNRKHTGTALEETLEVIEAMVASADEHFSQIVTMKNKFKAISVSRKEYAKLMGLLYFDKQVISSEQVNLIKREYNKPSFDYNDKGTLWEVYKMIMFGIVDQPPKSWYKQQMDINSYIQVLFNVASEELENEDKANELELDFVDDEQVSDNQVVQEDVENIPELHQENTEIIDLDAEEDDDWNKLESAGIITPCAGHDVETVKDEMETIDNLIAAQNMVVDAKAVRTDEPSIFDVLDEQVEIIEEPLEIIEDDVTIDLSDLEGEYNLDEMPAVIEAIEERIEEAKAAPMSEEQIEMVKEEYGIVEKGNPDDGLIGVTAESPEDLFDMMEEYDEPVDEVPWFTDEDPTQKVELAPSLIPDSMREAVSEILDDKYKNKRKVVNSIEDTDYVIFELDSKEFFVVDK